MHSDTMRPLLWAGVSTHAPNAPPPAVRAAAPAEGLRHLELGWIEGGLREVQLLLHAGPRNRVQVLLAGWADPPAVDPRSHGLDSESGPGGDQRMVHGLRRPAIHRRLRRGGVRDLFAHGTRLLGPIFTICTALSWMGVGIHR